VTGNSPSGCTATRRFVRRAITTRIRDSPIPLAVAGDPRGREREGGRGGEGDHLRASSRDNKRICRTARQTLCRQRQRRGLETRADPGNFGGEKAASLYLSPSPSLPLSLSHARIRQSARGKRAFRRSSTPRDRLQAAGRNALPCAASCRGGHAGAPAAAAFNIRPGWASCCRSELLSASYCVYREHRGNY